MLLPLPICNSLGTIFLCKGPLKMKTRLSFLLLLLSCGLASAQTADCNALTRQALDLSGFNLSIDHMAEMFSSDDFMRQVNGRQASDEVLTVFKPILVKQFNPSLLRKEMQDRVAAHCNPEQMARTVERLKSPFIARMLALEAATNTAEGQQKLKRYINIAKTVPPTDDRMDALDELEASSHASDFLADTTLAVIRGMLGGMGAPPEIVAEIQAHRKDMKTQMLNEVELSMSVIYHGVTRPELQQYAKELAAQPLKGFYEQVQRSFVEIVEERSRAMGQDLKKAAPPRAS
jgi:hypothetical protein